MTNKPWQGHLHLEFTHCPHRGHATALSHVHVQAPLKVQRPFYPEGAAVCHTVMLHTAGGVVGGDRLHINVALHPQACALVTSAAATKLYRSSGPEAQQTTQISVASGACLEWLPQETIVFDGAIHRQRMRIDLADDALWIGWDITRLGRSARGERFLTGIWRSHTEVWQQNRPLWIDPQWVAGGTAMLGSLHGLANCPVVGTFAVFGRSVPVELVMAARQTWRGDRLLEKTPESEVGVTRLVAGLLCRYRGHSTTEARRWFTDVWSLVRSALVGRTACQPRVWQR